MAALALALAVSATLGAVLPGSALYLAMFSGMLALATGMVAFRRRDRRPSHRLLGAAASGLGALALVLCTTRYVLVLAALGRLDRLIG
jgi:hypothetical protein